MIPLMQVAAKLPVAESSPTTVSAAQAVGSEVEIDDEESDAFYEEHLMSASNKMLGLHRIVSFCLSKNEKVLVFSYSTKMLDLAEDLLLESGIRPARLDGETPEADRRAAIEAFLRPPPAVRRPSERPVHYFEAGEGIQKVATLLLFYLGAECTSSRRR